VSADPGCAEADVAVFRIRTVSFAGSATTASVVRTLTCGPEPRMIGWSAESAIKQGCRRCAVNADLGLLVLRVVVGAVIIAHGVLKVGWVWGSEAKNLAALRGVAGWFGSLGFWPPTFWAVVSAAAESIGGLLTVLGLGGPLGPGIVFGDLIVVTIVAHVPKGFWAGAGGIEFPVTLGAGALAIAFIGNGAFSLDAALRLTYPDWLLPGWIALMIVGAVLALSSRAFSASRAKSAP